MLELFPQSALQESIEEVLEKMFFASVVEDCGAVENSLSPAIAARLRFEGDPTGEFLLKITPDAGRSIAADFLGEEEASIPNGRVEEVICELANILCGSTLSRARSESIFRLSSPAIVSPDPVHPASEETIHAVGLANGSLSIHVWLDHDASAATQLADADDPAENIANDARVDGTASRTLQ